MLILETIGYYSDEPGSQNYPPLVAALYPSEGNFIGVVGNVSSGKLVRQVVESFRRQIEFPCEGASLPASIPGVGFSDHWAFWQEGYKAVKDSKQPEGFFHGLGHGLGLEVHEEPFMRPTSTWKFKKGMVVTVEPGLYYRGIGGARFEDVVHLVPGGNELISKAPYKWQIS